MTGNEMALPQDPGLQRLVESIMPDIATSLVGAKVNPALPFGDLYPWRQDWILQDVIDWVATTGQRLSELMSYWWYNLISFLSGIWEWIYSQASNAINNWWYGIQYTFYWIQDTVFNIWNKLWTIGSEIYAQVSQALQGVGNYIVNTIIPFFQQLPGQILNGLQQGWNFVATTVTDGLAWIGDRLGEISHNIENWSTEQWQHLVDFWNGFTANFTEWMGNTGDWLVNLGTDLVKIPGLVLSGIEDIGKTLGKGIVDWMEKDAHETVKELEEAEKFEDLAGHSPWLAIALQAVGHAIKLIGPWLGRLFSSQFVQWALKMLPFAAILGMEVTGELDDLVAKYVTPAFTGILEHFESLGPMAPQPGINIAIPLTKVLTTTISGLSTLALAGGLLGFLKQVGLGQLAAMIYDLTNFRTLTAAFMTTLATVYISQPIKYYYQNIATPYLPDLGHCLSLAGEYALATGDRTDPDAAEASNRAEFIKLVRFHGFSTEWGTKLYDLADTPARYFALRGMADAGLYDEPYFISELMNSGYNVPTIKHMLDMLRKYSLGEIKSYFLTTAVNRFKEGHTTDQQFKTELLALGVTETRLDHYLYGAQLAYQYDYTADLVSAYSTQYQKGMTTEADFRGQLQGLGIMSDRVNAFVIRENAKKFKAPKVKTVPEPGPEYLTDEGQLKVNTVKEAYRRNLATAEELYAELVKLQMPLDLAEAYVEYEITKKTPKIAE